ncbi:exodeoxyribonuclease VII small subunit [Gallaecimonas kandeliae]|uniref:exodeoxyribonuclease VII small subunit n=1 Tax=Gallaecimonas kandeliae TaxID=3029055 RepID=UPI002648EA6A|nr:exodeoxyribonuclease VII small subunit [Gallaecimonas kandeliae]WKE64906.1 exodeoxyribonuclease VII small subunit [Gallaecimonas kandeliae]
MAKKQPDNMSFEESLQELEAVVLQLEQGELSLDEALKQFERGVALSRASEQKLKAAEQKVQMLLEDGKTLAPFNEPEQ